MATHVPRDFTYPSLPSASSFRLLEFQEPASDGTLSFTLSVCDIQNHRDTPYYCLSYTWGNPFAHGGQFREHFDAVDAQYSDSNTANIYVNGHAFPVRQSLHDALSVLSQDSFRRGINTRDDVNGRTLLHLAAGRGNVKLINTWLAHGADINQLDDEGNSALHFAAGNGKVESVSVLLQHGSQSVPGSSGETPIDVARKSGYNEVVSRLESNPNFRNALPIPGKLLLWVDAISINQSDVEEKSAQVALMDRIYACATCVVAWLGPSDEHTEVALRTLNTLKNHLKEFQESDIEPFSGKDKAKYTEAGIPYISRAEWVSLGSLYQRQWFRRAWIVQEALLPPFILMYIGNESLQWRDVGKVAEAIRRIEAKIGSSGSTEFVPLSEVAVPIVWNMAELVKWRGFMFKACRENDQAKEYQAFFTPDELSYNLVTFLASDPRDKIYAYYGLLNLFSERRRTDYGLSISAVYTKATREIIASQGNLHVLSWCVNSMRRRSDLPSWVPDYSIGGANAIPRSFAADKGLQYTPVAESDLYSHVFRVKGARIGYVTKVSGRPGTGENEKVRFDRSWLTLPLSLEDRGQIISCMLWQTLCMNMSSGGMFDPEEYDVDASDEMGLQFRVFLTLLICAAADGKIREKLELPHTSNKLTFSLLDYDPMKEDMEPILADLDAFEARDGSGCWVPSREEVLRYWNNFKYNLLRNTEAAEDRGPTDVYLPDGVTPENSRPIGNEYVLLSSRFARQSKEFISAYSSMYGGRQLITCDDAVLGLASVSVLPQDEIWLLPGLNAPAVLRPVPAEQHESEATARQFLGSCFLWDMMHGKLSAVVEKPMQDLEII